MMSRLSKILLAILLLFACGPAFAGKRVALVLGNSAYQSVPRLTNPANDAALMTDTFKKAGLLRNAAGPYIGSEADLRRQMLNVRSASRPDIA